MSKEETGCKLTPVYKHKERKPKKPHYIPRPWGKPYNYKCFQCPFTCMEKSHLYNHMKYSLCKNSLSLLIESDWPYKKGHLLHPQLRLVQATETSQVCGQRDVPVNCDGVMAGTTSPKDGTDRDGRGSRSPGKEDAASSERMSEKTSQFQEEEEEEDICLDPEEKKEKVKETQSEGQSMDPGVNALLLQFKNKPNTAWKDSSPDFIITDVFSLKKHASKGKERTSVELNPKPKHCKVARKCPGSSKVFTEQWKLVVNGQERSPTEVLTPGADRNAIPCYPPPAYGEFHEAQGLNLSLLGINYPLPPNLFSYLSPSVNGSIVSHSHLSPFLASAAHLMPPPSPPFQPLQNSERSAFLPRFYYPLLFDHSITSAENKVVDAKPDTQHLPVMAVPAPLQVQTSTEPTQKGLLKVPVLKTALPWTKTFCEHPRPEQSPKRLLDEEKKWLVCEKESCSLLDASQLCRKISPDAFQGLMGAKEDDSLLPSCIKKAELPGAACSVSSGAVMSPLKRKIARGGLDVKESNVATPEKVTYQGSSGLQATPIPSSKSMDHWQVELHGNISEGQEKTRSSDVLSPMITASSHPFGKSSNEPTIIIGPRDKEVSAVLIGDLSKTLEEYQEVEKKLSHLAKEDTPSQEHLRDQLVKIRHELFHIHKTLEKATKSNEGPLDLSVKRSPNNLEKGHQDKKEPKVGIQDGKVQGKDPGSTNRYFEVGGQEEEASDCLETVNKTIDLLIKTNHSKKLRTSFSETHLGDGIKAEVVPPGVPLEFRHVMGPYYSHTTKCEADSSILLCTDGRSTASQGLPLSVTEDAPQGCQIIPPHSLSCSQPSETDKV